MTAKIEAGVGWMCAIHDSNTIQSEMPAVEMEQPISVKLDDKYNKVRLDQGDDTTINIKPYDLYTQVVVHTNIDDGSGEIELTAAKGLVEKLTPKLTGEVAGFESQTHYFLKGNGSTIEFGQPRSATYLKVAHEVEYPALGKVISK